MRELPGPGFCGWLSGFSDGEASFIVDLKKSKAGNLNVAIGFTIRIRDDDAAVIHYIKTNLGVGRVRYGLNKQKDRDNNPICYIYIGKILDCLYLSNIFRKYPLRSKKSKEQELWREVINLRLDVAERRRKRAGKITDAELERVAEIKEFLGDWRAYPEEDIDYVPLEIDMKPPDPLQIELFMLNGGTDGDEEEGDETPDFEWGNSSDRRA